MKMRIVSSITVPKTLDKINGPGGPAELLGVNPISLRSRIRKLGIPFRKVFAQFFRSNSAAVHLGLHAKVVGPELFEMASEFDSLRAFVEIDTPNFDELLSYVPNHDSAAHREEMTT
jgi:hypothetical protein